MGDRCYMSVNCRREDQARFKELGFVVGYGEDNNSPIIEMIDEEANFAHYDKMPTNIPYYGNWGAGSEYGPGRLVCDGKDYEEVPATSDGFVIEWDYVKLKPKPKSILEIRRYLKLEKKVQKLFKKWREAKSKEHIFSPDTNTCVKCGITTEDDAVENQPCIK